MIIRLSLKCNVTLTLLKLPKIDEDMENNSSLPLPRKWGWGFPGVIFLGSCKKILREEHNILNTKDAEKYLP